MVRSNKYIVPVIAVLIGLLIGLGAGQLRINKERKIAQDKLKEAGRKIAYIQKKTADEKAEATIATEQKCRSDLDLFQNEKKTLEGQLEKLSQKTRFQEAKVKEAEETAAGTKKELQEAGKKYAQLAAQSAQNKKDMEHELKKITNEKSALQNELKKTMSNLGHCEKNNAELCIIAQEVVKKYRNKGIGTVILEKEPLTQIKKVDLERLTQKYLGDIEQQKIRKRSN